MIAGSVTTFTRHGLFTYGPRLNMVPHSQWNVFLVAVEKILNLSKVLKGSDDVLWPIVDRLILDRLSYVK